MILNEFVLIFSINITRHTEYYLEVKSIDNTEKKIMLSVGYF